MVGSANASEVTGCPTGSSPPSRFRWGRQGRRCYHEGRSRAQLAGHCSPTFADLSEAAFNPHHSAPSSYA
ncbi:MAG: hypothetical protein ACK559_06920, partial [bacterium]